MNTHNTKPFMCTCKSKRKFYMKIHTTKKETAKFQGSISTQCKALGIWNWQNVNKRNNWENKHGKRWTAFGKKTPSNSFNLILSLAYSNPNVNIELFSVAIMQQTDSVYCTQKKRSYKLLQKTSLVAILDCFHGNRCCKLWNLSFNIFWYM